MKFRILAVTATLALFPTLALAMGCGSDHHPVQASSCAEGHVWDEKQGDCVKATTS